MDREDYIAKLKDIHFELMGLSGEAVTADGQFVDDEANGRLAEIVDNLDTFLQQLDG